MCGRERVAKGDDPCCARGRHTLPPGAVLTCAVVNPCCWFHRMELRVHVACRQGGGVSTWLSLWEVGGGSVGLVAG